MHDIEMDDLELRMLDAHTETRPSGDGFAARLKAGVQSFGLVECETMDEAQWYRLMLAKALAAIVREESDLTGTD